MTNPSKIFSGHSHSFDVGIAHELGINSAIVFNHIVYWIRFNAQKHKNSFRDGKFWMYEKQQDIANSLGYLTVDEVKRATVRLLDAGLLIKSNYNENKFDKTNWYTVYDQKIITSGLKVSNNSYERAVQLDRESCETPSEKPQNSLYNKETTKEHKEQQQEAAPAGVVFLSSEQKEVSEKLAIVGVKEATKKYVLKNFTLPKILHALAYITHSSTEINTTIDATLKWACQEQPDIPISEKENEESNKKLAKEMESKIARPMEFMALGKLVEIAPSVGKVFCLPYNEKGFKQKLEEAIKKYKLL